MAFSLLTELRPGGRHWSVCVRVARMWEYRGGTDDGRLQHVDLVLIDEQGNGMSAEIGPDDAADKALLLREGHVYVFSRFMVSPAKKFYRPVEARYVITFTFHTLVEEKTEVPATFPKFIYDPVPFSQLSSYVGENQRFLDVVAIIVSVSETSTIHISGQPAPTTRRHIVLRDESNHEMKLTLWGRRATEFPADDVISAGASHPVAAIFVGEDSLSGNAACRWYINPDDSRANALVASFKDRFEPIAHIAASSQPTAPRVPSTQIQEKTLFDLSTINPYDFPPEGFKCTVVIARLVPGQSWWFASCKRCGKKSLPHGDGYKCTECPCTGKRFRYKICVVCTDGTAEAEFMLFGDIGQEVVGKQVGFVLRAGHQDHDFPPDIAAIVSKKYTWNVTLTDRSFFKKTKTFQVNSIDVCFGRQLAIPHVQTVTADASSSSALLAWQKSTHTDNPERTTAIASAQQEHLASTTQNIEAIAGQAAYTPSDVPDNAPMKDALPNKPQLSARKRLFDNRDEDTAPSPQPGAPSAVGVNTRAGKKAKDCT